MGNLNTQGGTTVGQPGQKGPDIKIQWGYDVVVVDDDNNVKTDKRPYGVLKINSTPCPRCGLLCIYKPAGRVGVDDTTSLSLSLRSVREADAANELD